MSFNDKHAYLGVYLYSLNIYMGGNVLSTCLLLLVLNSLFPMHGSRLDNWNVVDSGVE